jgi:hypothetical protein
LRLVLQIWKADLGEEFLCAKPANFTTPGIPANLQSSVGSIPRVLSPGKGGQPEFSPDGVIGISATLNFPKELFEKFRYYLCLMGICPVEI